MSFATRMWARKLVNTATTARTSFLRPHATALKAHQPFRTMATAVQQGYAADIPITTITEDRDFGG